MGMTYDKYYGFGFDYNAIDDNELLLFFKNHHETILKIDEDFAQESNKDDADIDELLDLGEMIEPAYGWNVGSFAGLISEVMRLETDIGFGAYSDTESGDIYIMWESTFPWKLNDKEKSLTYESLTEIIDKYTDELGVRDVADYHSVEVFG